MEHVWWRSHLRGLTELGPLGSTGLQLGNFQEVDDFMPFLLEALELPAGGRVLELGCGRGSFSIRLAQWGYRVTGVDDSEPLLATAWEHARSREAEVDFRLADPRILEERSVYDGALILDFGAYSDPDNAAMVRAAATALRPGGRLVFGTCNPYYWSRRPRTEHRAVERTDIIRKYSFDFNAAALVSRVRCILADGKRRDLPVAKYRAYTLPELRHLVSSTGLADLRVYGQDESGAVRTVGAVDALATPYFHCVALRPITGEAGEGI